MGTAQARIESLDRLDTSTNNSGQFFSEKPTSQKLVGNRRDYDAWVGQGIEANRKLSARLRVRAGSQYLNEADYALLDAVAARLGGCHAEEWVQRDLEGKTWLASTSRCMIRFCPICAAKRTQKFQDRMGHWYQEGQWWVDGNGKLRGNRDIEEIGEAAAADLALSEALHLEDEIAAMLEKADREAEHHQIRLSSHLITLTIPNIPHVWDYAAPQPNLLDLFLIEPFRRMMASAKRWRLKEGRRTPHQSHSRATMRRAMQRSRRAGRKTWSWKRPRGRRYVLGLSVIAAIRGYARVVEITVNRRNKTYHPHLHILTLGDRGYIPKGIIRHLWRHYTENPAITQVNIKKADPATIGKELVKYLTKINDIRDGAMLQEIIRATYRRRMIQMGGIMFGPKFSRYQYEKARAKRLAQKPIATKGMHIKRRWDARTHTYIETVFRRVDKDLPIKTGEQWQIPLVQTPEGEIVSRFGRDQFLARQAARHLPAVDFTSRMKWVIAVEVRRKKDREEAEGRRRSDQAYQQIQEDQYQARLNTYILAWALGSLLELLDREDAA